MKQSKKGNLNSALNHFKKAARFGNYFAINLVSTHHIDPGDYIEALAWLKLIDLNFSQQQDMIVDAVELLSQKLNPAEIEATNQRHQELILLYGRAASIKCRKNWRDGLKFTGTRIHGKVPEYLSFVYETGDARADQPVNAIPSYIIDAQL